MKLVKDLTKREYELTYLLASDLLDAEVAKIRKEIADLVSKLKGEIITDEDWGRKRLAYKIRYASKGQEEAIFTHLVIKFPSQAVAKMSKELALNHKILRNLLVVKEEVEPKAKDDTLSVKEAVDTKTSDK